MLAGKSHEQLEELEESIQVCVLGLGLGFSGRVGIVLGGNACTCVRVGVAGWMVEGVGWGGGASQAYACDWVDGCVDGGWYSIYVGMCCFPSATTGYLGRPDSCLREGVRVQSRGTHAVHALHAGPAGQRRRWGPRVLGGSAAPPRSGQGKGVGGWSSA
jgi:hypothetical protein